jgi:hypothetical protein
MVLGFESASSSLAFRLCRLAFKLYSLAFRKNDHLSAKLQKKARDQKKFAISDTFPL